MRALRTAALAFLASAAAVAAPPLALRHQPPGCILAGGRARLEATVESGEVSSLRVYFRESRAAEEYFLEMLEDRPGHFVALLPRLASGSEAVSYRLLVRGPAGAESSTPAAELAVTSDCATPELSGPERQYAASLVLGRLAGSGPLQGFTCEGIIGEVSPQGQLLPAAECAPAPAFSETAPSSVVSRSAIERAAPRHDPRRVVSRSRP
jgi:hypothetical protein